MCIRDSIKFVGTGEKLEDLEVFHPERMASRILGMGDVLTLIERAQNEVDEKQALEMAKKLKENSFDMNDLLDNLMKIQKMGPLKQVLGMLPGVGKMCIRDRCGTFSQKNSGRDRHKVNHFVVLWC